MKLSLLYRNCPLVDERIHLNTCDTWVHICGFLQRQRRYYCTNYNTQQALHNNNNQLKQSVKQCYYTVYCYNVATLTLAVVTKYQPGWLNLFWMETIKHKAEKVNLPVSWVTVWLGLESRTYLCTASNLHLKFLAFLSEFEMSCTVNLLIVHLQSS